MTGNVNFEQKGPKRIRKNGQAEKKNHQAFFHFFIIIYYYLLLLFLLYFILFYYKLHLLFGIIYFYFYYIMYYFIIIVTDAMYSFFETFKLWTIVLTLRVRWSAQRASLEPSQAIGAH